LVTRYRPTAVLLFLLLLCAGAASAQRAGSEPIVTKRVDWLSRLFFIDIQAPLPTTARNFPAAAYVVEERVQGELPRILQEHAGIIQIDSFFTLADHYDRDPRLAVEVAGLSDALVPTSNRQTPDLRALQLQYSLSLYPALAELFVEHDRPRELPRVISWRPSREFTGLVVYAQGQLPVHGEERVARVRPAVLPDVYSHEATQVVLQPDRVRPEVLTSRGPVAYATSATAPVVRERAGSRPMRTVAVGVFGRYATDPIISAQDADVFFANTANHELIRDGRVVIIIEESVLDR
jgi:hypothetical protein